jgi:phosphohistidine phosphatase
MAQDADRALVLFRHAKSAWPPDVPDHDRPLAGRGIGAAPVMGRWLRGAGLVPSLVLCSTARRARETWELAQTGLAATPPVIFEPGVYEATAGELLALIRAVPDQEGTLLLVGHNPGIGDLAALLAAAASGSAGPGDLERMRAKFPTAAIAVLRSAGTWGDLAPRKARLTAFVTPHGLGARPAEAS